MLFLLGYDLSANFAARIGSGVHIDIPLTGQQVSSLVRCQHRATLHRALAGIVDTQSDTGIFARFCRAMKVRRLDRSAQAALTQGIAQGFGGLVKFRLQLAHACAGIGWHFGGAR